MGTLFYFHFYSVHDKDGKIALQAAIERVEQINLIASDYLPQSELTLLNQAPPHQPVTVSHDLFQIISRATEISKMTDGAFDITAAHASQNWRRAKRQKKLPTPQQTAKALTLTNWRALQLNSKDQTVIKTIPDLLIDLGGIAKGYAAEAALKVLREHGCAKALVAASGDLAIGDPPPGKTAWPVRLKLFNDLPHELTPPTLHLSNCAVSTSGDLHQTLILGDQRYSHIIDPRTALGLPHRIACAVISKESSLSDALATAACVLGPEKTRSLFAPMPSISCYMIQLPKTSLIIGPVFHALGIDIKQSSQ